MEVEINHTKVEIHILAYTKMIKFTDMVHTNGLMEDHLLANFKMVIFMGMELKFGQVNKFTKVNTKTIRDME